MTKIVGGALALVLYLTMLSPSFAGYIVNTGPGPNDVNIANTASARYGDDQFLGFQLMLSQLTKITGVEGWISVIPGGSGLGRASLYSDVDNSPGDLLFSRNFVSPVTDFTGTYSHAEWLGATNLDWEVGPAKYWLTFEANSGGVVGGFLLPSVHPLDFEVYSQGNGKPWIHNDGLGLGVRVSGAIPEPSTLALLCLGLAGLCVLSRVKPVAHNLHTNDKNTLHLLVFLFSPSSGRPRRAAQSKLLASSKGARLQRWPSAGAGCQGTDEAGSSRRLQHRCCVGLPDH